MWEWLHDLLNMLLWTVYGLALIGQFLGLLRDKLEEGNRTQPG